MEIKTDADRLCVLVHTYEALASSAAHIYDPTLDVEEFRVQTEVLSRDYPTLRPAIARIYLSLSELQTASAKLLPNTTNWSDQRLYSKANPCHPIWETLQKDIAAFDNAYKALLWQRR